MERVPLLVVDFFRSLDQPGAEGDPCEQLAVLHLGTLGEPLVRPVGMEADRVALSIISALPLLDTSRYGPFPVMGTI